MILTLKGVTMASMNRGFLAMVALVLSAPSLIGQQPPADFLLLNGKIFTSNSSQAFAEALAIRGDRIQAAGTRPKGVQVASPQAKRLKPCAARLVPRSTERPFLRLPRPR